MLECAAVLGGRALASSYFLRVISEAFRRPAASRLVSVARFMCYDETPLEVKYSEGDRLDASLRADGVSTTKTQSIANALQSELVIGVLMQNIVSKRY